MNKKRKKVKKKKDEQLFLENDKFMEEGPEESETKF